MSTQIKPAYYAVLPAGGSTGTGDAVEMRGTLTTATALVTGSGAVSSTIAVDGSQNGTNWQELGSIALSGTGEKQDTLDIYAAWRYLRGRRTAINGTSAVSSLIVGAV